MSEFDNLFEQIRTESIQKSNRELAQEMKSIGNYVAANRLYKNAVQNDPENWPLLNEYAVNLLYIGETKKAHSIFSMLIDKGEVCAPSNYMLACDYLGIPNSERIDISKLYFKQEKTTVKHNWRDHKKIRVCYITSDAHYHPAGRALAKIIKAHNKDRFEITMLYTSGYWDLISKEIIENCARFVDIGSFPNEGAMTNEEVYKLIQNLEIDILVDLDGHTNAGLRLHVLAHRPTFLNFSMLGYPCNTGLPFIDRRIGSECCQFEEPTFINRAGYMPIFRTIEQKERVKKDREYLLFGAIANPAKITEKDLKHYDHLLSQSNNIHLMYARLGHQYSESRADEIMRAHHPDNRGRISVVNLANKGYVETLNTFDALVDTNNWNLHATMIDAISCGVPVLRGIYNITKAASCLSMDIYTQLNMHHGCVDAFNDFIKTGSKDTLNVLSDLLFNKMVSFDNTIEWTRETERAFIELLKDV